MQIFSPMLSSRIFIVLHFTLRSVIHFELFFVTGIKSMSGSLFFGMWMSVVPTPFERFVENLCCCSFFLCKWSVDCISCGFISGLSVSLIYLSILSPVSPCFDYCRFIVNLKVGQYHLHSKDSQFPPLHTSHTGASHSSFPSQ